MSGFMTAAGENYLLDLITMSGSTLPTYFVALGRVDPPTRHMAGTEFDEPRSVDYGRAPYTNASGRWTERVGSVSNTQPVVFPICTTDWGILRHWAITTSDIGGKLLWAGSFTVPITVGPGDQVILEPGTITIKTQGNATSVML